MTKQAIQQEALSRATSGYTLTNYPAIYQGFIDKGIPEAEIKPRINVFTYEAWRAIGRQVRKGEHGVKIVTGTRESNDRHRQAQDRLPCGDFRYHSPPPAHGGAAPVHRPDPRERTAGGL